MRANVRTVLTSAAAWLGGLVGAVAVGVLALSMIGDGLGTRAVEPLTPDGVVEAAAASPTPSLALTAKPTASSKPPSTAAVPGPERVVHTSAGFVLARCTAGQAYLISWTPAQGYLADDVHRGPGTRAWLEFRPAQIGSDRREVHLTVSCLNGEPQGQTTTEDDD